MGTHVRIKDFKIKKLKKKKIKKKKEIISLGYDRDLTAVGSFKGSICCGNMSKVTSFCFQTIKFTMPPNLNKN